MAKISLFSKYIYICYTLTSPWLVYSVSKNYETEIKQTLMDHTLS